MLMQHACSRAPLQRWEEHTRTLRPCAAALVASGRCFQASTDDALPLLLPLNRVASIGPSVAEGAFARGVTPTCSWLYFTVRWSRAADAAVSPPAPRRPVHDTSVTRPRHGH